jgi:hypothetical protein
LARILLLFSQLKLFSFERDQMDAAMAGDQNRRHSFKIKKSGRRIRVIRTKTPPFGSPCDTAMGHLSGSQCGHILAVFRRFKPQNTTGIHYSFSVHRTFGLFVATSAPISCGSIPGLIFIDTHFPPPYDFCPAASAVLFS